MSTGNRVIATDLNFPECKAEEQTPDMEWVPGVPGSGGQHVFHVAARSYVGREVVYLCRKWFKGFKAASSNGMKTTHIYGFYCQGNSEQSILCMNFPEANAPLGWGQGGGMVSLFCSACTFLITASSTFKSFNGLNHIKKARSKLCLGHTCQKGALFRSRHV